VLVWITRVARLRARDLGITTESLGASVALGIAAGGFMGVLGSLLLAHPVVLAEPVRVTAEVGLGNVPLEAALLLVVVVNVAAIFEEVLFRGLIQVEAVARFGPAPGIAISVTAFVLWHVVIVYQAVQLTNLTQSVIPWQVLYLGGAVPLGVAGVIFSLL